MPLSFFTNSAGSYGSAIPFQRIVEPAQLGFFLNLEQAELLRIQRYNEGWRFYFGKHWTFKREDGEPLITFNYYRKIIDKSVAFLVARGFSIKTPESLEEVTLPFLNEVWEYNNRNQFAWDAAIMGAVTGDVFALITYEEPTPMQRQVNPFSQGRIRINLLGSEQVFPTWDPLNVDTLVAARIETLYYAERGTHQVDRDDRANHDGRQLYTKRFTQVITRQQIVEQFHGEMPVVRQNLLGEIPLVHIKNRPIPKEYYGLPDGMDIIDVQRSLNESSTDIADVVNYHAAPVTIVYGAKTKTLERGPRAVWSGLPERARVETLKLEGDLHAAHEWVKTIKQTLHELSGVPEKTLGGRDAISNTSGVALHMDNQPLIELTDTKRAQYQPGFERINYFVERIGQVKGLISLPFDLCKHCGGRIVEVELPQTTKVWDPTLQAFVDVPLRRKRCYKIDKQSLEFIDPNEERIKWWRQYGFGMELRDMTLRQVIDEIQQQKRSFWDYTVLQEAMLAQWRTANATALQGAHQQQMAQVTPPPSLPGPDGQPVPQPASPPLAPALVPQASVEPPKIQPPPMLVTRQLPVGEIEVPEEPEMVTIVRTYLNPDTGYVALQDTVELFLVPTGCRRPAYLDPFTNQVTFLDVLPKDEALQAQLYASYQDKGWVDPEWVQGKIPEIAVDAAEIRRRMKPQTDVTRTMQPATAAVTTPGLNQMTQYMGQAAPANEKIGMVPGPGGNPQNPMQQLGNGNGQ